MVDHGGCAAVVHLEGVGGPAGEPRREVDEEAGVGTGVSVDDLVVVAHAEHVERGPGDEADEQHVGRREVLELVDQEVAVAGLDPSAQAAVAEEGLDGRGDLLVEVDDAAPLELGPVGVDHVGQARDVAAVGLHLGRVSAGPGGPR